MAMMLTDLDATVTLCHSMTQDIESIVCVFGHAWGGEEEVYDARVSWDGWVEIGPHSRYLGRRHRPSRVCAGIVDQAWRCCH